MGYRWQEYTQGDLGYDLFIFKRETACIVRVRQTAYRIDPDTLYEEILRDDLKSGPLAPVPFVVPYRNLAAHPARAGLAPAPGHGRSGGCRTGIPTPIPEMHRIPEMGGSRT
jgi:hypothetical protein